MTIYNPAVSLVESVVMPMTTKDYAEDRIK